MSESLSKSTAIISTVVSTFGTGILFMPSCFMLMGYVVASLALVLSGFLTYYTLYALGYSTVMVECKHDASYPKVGSLFSRPLKIIIDIAMLGSNLGVICVIIRYLSSYCADMLGAAMPATNTEFLRRVVLCATTAIMTYFGTLESLSSLAFISKISLAGVVFYICLVAYYAMFHGTAFSELKSFGEQYSQGFIKAVFAMHCQFSFLSIYNQMDDKSLGSVSVVSAVSGAAIALMCFASGILGYIAVGNEIGTCHILQVFKNPQSAFMQKIMANSFDKGGYLPKTILVMFLFVWFGLLCFASNPCIPIIQSYLTFKGKPISRLSVAMLIALMCLAAGVPATLDIDTVLSVVAAVFTNPLSFMFPCIFMLYTAPRYSTHSVVSGLTILFSLGIMISILKDALF